MSTALHAGNRLVALALGLVLVVTGLAAIAWWNGSLTRWWPSAPSTLDPTGVQQVTATTWWIWVALVAGLALIALALRWLLAHLRTDAWGRLTLTGSSAQGKLTLDPSAATGQYTALLRQEHTVRTSHARLVRDHDRPVLQVTTKLAADADLDALVDRVVELTSQAQEAASIQPLGVRHRLAAHRNQRSGRRYPT